MSLGSAGINHGTSLKHLLDGTEIHLVLVSSRKDGTESGNRRATSLAKVVSYQL